MLFEIKHNVTAKVLFSLETDSLKLCVEAAVESKINLRGAYLEGADLEGANLRGANLEGADLGDIKPATPEQAIANLDKVREIILAEPERLQMNHWHEDEAWIDRTCAEEASCGTTHCLAGWLQVCSTDPEVRKLEPNLAGIILAPVASRLFYSTDEEVMRWLENRDYAKETQA